MSSNTNPNIFTVSRLNAEVRMLLENEMGIVWLVGELSNFSAPVSGHWYFSLKDSRAQVKCAMFKGNNRRVVFKPANGNQVLVKARLSLYEPRGDYQLIIESMQPEGDGRLQQMFDELKMKLAGEGLFAQSLKQPLPKNPKCIGVITSKTGAALYDILDVLKRRDPSLPVIIYPTVVQGEDAPFKIAQAIGRANTRNECDILIVGRGGGSLEDLWCFNHEIVARTIAASQIPIVSAVGHEIDVTIADFVADVRAPTPSAAAEIVSRDNSHKDHTLVTKQQRLQSAWRQYLSDQKVLLNRLTHQLERRHPRYQLEKQSQRLDDISARLYRATRKKIDILYRQLENTQQSLGFYSPANTLNRQRYNLQQKQDRLIQSMKSQLIQNKHQLALRVEKLDTVSPLSTLKRGYSITKNNDGELITQVEQLKSGQEISTTFANGTVRSIVK
ncbi:MULTISPECIES: exodeoxyribonuclease VII large subunit [Vibrio]|uniref:Exodeoxyribonuclease 7 large subunit n=1 Tax=Vibrio casei TaxID=673372 RepID=A0A368LMC2_9VIBR|nr:MULTISPECIES: exodeoxyribonuclease VII large subunit [Vibrio]RCS72663.1 exodeoxyribonuclease VII large subunit [Vibrio casei]SJN23379.1 Exodeoxyribonuclease VII large subunit [Vibrio casei]HBV75628.1 exodeoxyribonuclease VII large subunit [Vibrio sp.]